MRGVIGNMEIIPKYGIQDMYPSWARGFCSFDQYREYRKKIEGYWDDSIHGGFHKPLKEVNRMSEPYMNRYCDNSDRDIHFLFETDKWNNNKITEMTSSHIINSALMLLKKASEFKLNYELFIIDNSNDRLLTPKDKIETIAELEPVTWIKTTPIFIALTKELANRKLLKYFEIVLDRFEGEKGTED